MKRARLIFLASSLVCLSAVAARGKDEIRKDSFLSGGKKHTYSIYVPKSVEGSKTPAPLLVALHGSGRDGLSLVTKWKDLAAKEGFIVAGPDAVDPKGWFIPQDSPDPLHDLVEELKSKYPVDAKRVYLFGHSAGAEMALMLSVIESEYFAAVAIHAGALAPESYGYIDLAKRKTPISIIVGTKDPFFPLDLVRATKEALNKRGFDAQLSEIPGHDHWYYDRAAEFNRALWDFLKKQQLAEEPRYEHYNFTK
jgi:poly(3-hydroxybutyrate) depolymerase